MTPQRAGEVKCTPRQCEETPLHFFFTHTALSQGHRSSGLFLKVSFSLSVKSTQLLSQQTRVRSHRLVHTQWNCVSVFVFVHKVRLEWAEKNASTVICHPNRTYASKKKTTKITLCSGRLHFLTVWTYSFIQRSSATFWWVCLLQANTFNMAQNSSGLKEIQRMLGWTNGFWKSVGRLQSSESLDMPKICS